MALRIAEQSRVVCDVVPCLPPTSKRSLLQSASTPSATLCSFGSFDKDHAYVYSQDLSRWSFVERGMVSMLGYRAQLLIRRLKRFFLWFFLVIVLSYFALLVFYLLWSPSSPFSPMPQ